MKKIKVVVCIIISLFMTIALSGERSPQWSKVRKQHLQIEPICQICGISKSLEVHHIKPFHLHPELELEQSNLITLCDSKYWGFNDHLLVGHGGNFKWENPWIIEDVAKIKVIASPAYIRKNGTKDRDDYLKFIHNRVQIYNIKSKGIAYAQ